MPTAQLNGTALASIAVGSLLLYSGVTGKGILASVQYIVSGQNPAGSAQVHPISGQAYAGSIADQPGPFTGSGASQGDVQGYQAYAFSLFPSYGWGSDQENALIMLWNKESGWNPEVSNPSSGAYGIPQALPGNKMAAAGSDWKTNPQTQIRWGLGYIKSEYGSPAVAWEHEVSNGWY